MVLVVEVRGLLLTLIVCFGHREAASVATVAVGMKLQRLSMHIGAGMVVFRIVGVVGSVSRSQVASEGCYAAHRVVVGCCGAVKGMVVGAASYAADQETVNA